MTDETAVAVRDMPPLPVIAERPPTALLPTRGDLEAMALIAGQAIKATGMVPTALKTKEQALAVMLAGWELGLRPMTALRHIYTVNGKTEIETRAMVGIIRARDPRIQFSWPEYTSEAVTCEVRRPGQTAITRCRYTLEDAKKSGQYKAGPWVSYTRDMLYAAATKRACRLACPDLINAIESGLNHTEAEAQSYTMPDAEVTVLDMPADIPADAYNEGDAGDVPAEVRQEATFEDRAAAQHRTEGSEPIGAQIQHCIRRMKSEWDTASFDAYMQLLRDNGVPFTEAGNLSVSRLGPEATQVLADMRAALDGVRA